MTHTNKSILWVIALVFSAYSAASSKPLIDLKSKNKDERVLQLKQSNQVGSAAEEDEATEEDAEDFISSRPVVTPQLILVMVDRYGADGRKKQVLVPLPHYEALKIIEKHAREYLQTRKI
jgi:hypothetical protein